MDAAHLQRFLSNASRQATRNEIRELLKLIARPEIISLAGGLPTPEVFPLSELATLLPSALEREGARALQYGPTEGDTELRHELLRLLVELEGKAFEGLTLENILITSASQQGLDLCSRVFISPGEAVVCGLPSYLGALGAFTACGARLSGIPLDDEGMRTDLLEQRLVRLRADGVHPKFIYTVPDFQNPSGVTYSRSRREDLLAVAREFDVLVLEDSPYRQLRYVGEPLPTLAELDRDGRVISLFTLSKMLSPGLRLGWVVADPEIIARLCVAKQPVDLCTSGLTQLATHEYLKTGHIEAQLERARGIYSKRREAMLAALERHLDPAWGARWNRPEGGFFVWLTLPEGVDGAVLLEQALREKVAFVTGSAFHCDGSGRNTIRLNFSFPEVDKIEIAVERLSRCIRKMAEETVEPAAPVPEAEMLVAGDHALEQLAWNLILSEVVE